MAAEAIDLGFAVCLVTDRTGNLTQVRLMWITVFKLGGFRLLYQLVHWTMAFETLAVFHGGIGRRQFLSMAVRAGNKSFGMEVVHILR